jgi:hypothetical protein
MMNRLRLASYGLLALLVVGAAGAAWAQASPPARLLEQAYDLSWYTVDGGGQTWSTGGSYTMGGTAGQPDAGWHAGGSYTLGGGFWDGEELAAVLQKIYVPLAVRGYTP